MSRRLRLAQAIVLPKGMTGVDWNMGKDFMTPLKMISLIALQVPSVIVTISSLEQLRSWNLIALCRVKVTHLKSAGMVID